MTTVTRHWFVFFVLLSIHARALTVQLRLRFKIWGIHSYDWNVTMKAQRKEEKKTNRETKFNSFCCTSGLLLSVVCCIALIHVELKLQQHHRVISQSATFCGQMEKEILQKVQQNYERWQINKGRNSEGTWHEAQGKVISPFKNTVSNSGGRTPLSSPPYWTRCRIDLESSYCTCFLAGGQEMKYVKVELPVKKKVSIYGTKTCFILTEASPSTLPHQPTHPRSNWSID